MRSTEVLRIKLNIRDVNKINTAAYILAVFVGSVICGNKYVVSSVVMRGYR